MRDVTTINERSDDMARLITKQQADEVMAYTNGFAMTYIDYLEALGVEVEIVEDDI